MAKPPKKKAPSGTLTERLGEARNRPYKGTKGGLPEKTSRYGKGRLNTARTPDSIRMGQASKGSVTSKKTVPLGDRPKLLSGPKAQPKPSMAGTLARGLYKAVGGPAIMLVSMTTEASPRGDADNPKGPLFSPSKNRSAGRGNPKTVNPYRKTKSSAATPSGSYFVTPKQPSGMTGKGRLRPEVKSAASTFKQKNLAANQKAGKDAATAQAAPKDAAPAVVKRPAFKGNWTGAAPTEMQKRGGAKIKRPNLLSLLRKRKG